MQVDAEKDYIISSRIPITQILPNPIILTLFKDKMSQITADFTNISTCLQDFIPSEYSLIIATPVFFLKNISKYPTLFNKQVILYEPHLIEDLGYTDTIYKLRLLGFSFIALTSSTAEFSFLKSPIIMSSSVQYFIKCIENQAFYTLFYIFKHCMLEGSIALICDNQTMIKKYKLFLKVINAKCDFYFLNGDKIILNNLVVNLCDKFYNNFICLGIINAAFNSDRVIYLANGMENMKEETFDFDKIGKYKYRIDDMCRALTPAVLSGKREFDYKRFESLGKEL